MYAVDTCFSVRVKKILCLSRHGLLVVSSIDLLPKIDLYAVTSSFKLDEFDFVSHLSSVILHIIDVGNHGIGTQSR